MPSQQIDVLQYPQDLTGELESNLVHEEVTLTAVNREDFNIIIPRCAPFYHGSVRLTKQGTNEILTFGKDYYIGGIFEGISPYTKNNQEVGSIIILLDQTMGGNFTLDYQTLGGDYILDETRFIALLKNKILNPVMVKWEEIHDKPIVYPADPHVHTPHDLDHYEALIAELSRLGQTLQQVVGDDKRGTPSYNQMLVTLIEQGLILEQLANRLANLQKELTQSTTGKISDALDKVDKALALSKQLTDNLNDAVTANLNKLKSDLTAYVNQEIEKLTNANSETGNRLTELLNKLRKQVQDDIAVELDKLKKKDVAHDSAIASLSSQITAGLATVAADATQLINELRNEATVKFNAILNNMVVKTGVPKQTIEGILEATHFESNSFGNDNGKVKFVNQNNVKQVQTTIGTKPVLSVNENGITVDGYISTSTGILALRTTDSEFTGLKIGESYKVELIRSGLHPVTKEGVAVYADLVVGDVTSKQTGKQLSKAVNIDGDKMNGPLGLVSHNLSRVATTANDWDWAGVRFTGGVVENGFAHGANELLMTPEKGRRHSGSTLGMKSVSRGEKQFTRGFIGSYSTTGAYVSQPELLTSDFVVDDVEATLPTLFELNEKKYALPSTDAVKAYTKKQLDKIYTNPTFKGKVNIQSTNNVGLTISRDTPQSGESQPSVGISLHLEGYGSGGIYHGMNAANKNCITLYSLKDTENHAWLEITKDGIKHSGLGSLETKFITWDSVYNWSENKQRIGDVVNKIVKVDGTGDISAGRGITFRAPFDAPAEQADKRIGISYAYDNAHGGVGLFVGGFMNVHHLGLRSDLRSKEDLKLIDNPLEKLDHLHGYTYKMKADENGRRAGVIAQEVEKVLPEVVTADKNGLLSVDYSGLVGLLIEAVKALKEENEVLKMEVRNLRSGIQSISREIAEDRKRW